MTLALFWHHMRLRLRERMEYRAAFLVGVVAQALGYGAEVSVIWLTLNRFDVIAGWDWSEMALLYSLSVITYALGAAFTYSPMTELELMVHRGTLESVLIKPTNPFLTLIGQRFNIGYVSHLLLAGSIFVWALTTAAIDWSLVNILLLASAVVSGALIQAGMLTLIGSWAFVFTRSSMLFGINGQLSNFLKWPITIFGNLPQVLLTLVFPLAFTTFYPAATLLSKEGQLFPGWIGWLTPLVGPLFFWIAYQVWMRGIDRYQGAGG